MTKKVFSCVLIGLGDIGLNYDLHRDQSKYIQTHSRAFFLNSGFDLQGGVDINTNACDFFTKKYKIKSYTLIAEALNEVKPDLIILALPTSFQLEAIKEIIRCFVPKAILCEFKIEKSICLPLVGPGNALDDMILPDDYDDNFKMDKGMAPS